MAQEGRECEMLRNEMTTQVAECKDMIEGKHADVGVRIESLSVELEKQSKDNGIRFGQVREEVIEVREETNRKLEDEIAKKLKQQEEKIERLREVAEAKVQDGGVRRGGPIVVPPSLKFSGHRMKTRTRS